MLFRSESDTEDPGENFMKGYKSCSGKYALFLKPNEVLSMESQKQLSATLSANKKIAFLNLCIADTNKKTQTSEFRLFLNTKEIKKIKYFNSFTNFVNLAPRQQAQIAIHSY